MRNPHYGDDYYSQMWTRFPAYLVGILLGYLLHHTRNKKVVLNKVLPTSNNQINYRPTVKI